MPEPEVAMRMAGGDLSSTVKVDRNDEIGLLAEAFNGMSSELRDARAASLTPPYGPSATFNSFRVGMEPSKRIDYIFVSPRLRVLKFAVLTDSDGTRYPSDHFPVLARIELE